jgi:SAM-dependent methyltransferase
MGSALPTGPVLVYAGGDPAAGKRVRLPEGCAAISGEDLCAAARRPERPRALVVLDPGALPPGGLPERWWNVPVGLALPPGEDAAALIQRFGDALLEQLDRFDRIAVRDQEVWRALSASYGWGEEQRVECAEVDPKTLAARLCASMQEVVKRWGPSAKGIHRTRAAALERFLSISRARFEEEAALQICSPDNRWVQLLSRHGLKLRGAEAKGPAPGEEGEPDSFGLVLGEDLLQDCTPGELESLIQKMWRLARPGGSLVFLEDFVFPQGRGMSVRRFVRLVLEATERRVLLERVEALKYPEEEMYRGGFLAFSRLGP